MGRLLLLVLFCHPAISIAGEKVAFFGLTLLDQSLQSQASGGNSAEIARQAMLEEMVRQRFESEGYELVDPQPLQAKVDRHANVAKCYGCDSRIAAELGADYSLVGEVQKVSELILTINLQMRDSQSETMVKGGVVDIRGNTDESWSRGMRYILNNRFFKREEKQ